MTDITPSIYSSETQRSLDPHAKWGKHQFAVSLYRRLCDPTNNSVFSPYSIWLLLALASEGAAGETRDQLLNFIGCSTRKPSEHIVNIQSDFIKLENATGLFTNRGFDLKPSFQQVAQKLYRAIAESLDFGLPTSLVHINNWVANSTAGKICRILKQLDSTALLVAANAIYFKGQWTLPFERSLTADLPFKTCANKTKTVATMRQQSPREYFEDTDVQAVRINYLGSRLSMVIVLPNAQEGLAAFHQSLTAEYFLSLLKNMSEANVTLHLPRFKFDTSVDLSPELKRLGVERLFDPELADLSEMSDKPLFVGKMLHKALVELNEEGTEAAAVSALVTWFGCFNEKPRETRQVSMIVDHPFFFAIQDRGTDTILFMGSVVDPDPDAP